MRPKPAQNSASHHRLDLRALRGPTNTSNSIRQSQLSRPISLDGINARPRMQNLKPSPDTPYTFSIGDVHGCDAALARLLDACHTWDGNRQNRFVFLGDYIDRGPGSAAVIARLMSLQKQVSGQVTCLRGNHEEMLLHAYRGPISYDRWISNGGLPTLRSFGVSRPEDIPKDVISWLQCLPTSFNDGRRFFVHAGVDLERQLDEQLPEVLTWMREPFLTLADSVDPGRLIVHGHSPTQNRQPDLRRHRLNLDTGAVMGGPLTAAVFSDTQTRPLCFLTDAGDVEIL
jgi:serine/threonine protein phosphatase 1